MKTIVILSFTDHSKDPRENKQIRWFKDHYDIISVGLGDSKISGVKFFPAFIRKKESVFCKIFNLFFLMIRNYEKYYWGKYYIKECAVVLSKIEFDLIIAHDIECLPVALKCSKNVKVIFDAHEYYPADNIRWKYKYFYNPLKDFLCKEYLSKCDVMLTVCDGIANKYKTEYNVDSIVITNTLKYLKEIEPSIIHENKIRLIHHGAAMPDRKIENMIKMMDFLDERFELDLILVPGEKKYFQKLHTFAKKNKRINFLKPVLYHKIIKTLNSYDIGLYILEPLNFNCLNSLPNKFFEFIQARLMLAIGPSPEMSKLINKYDLGVVSSDFSPKLLANSLNKLTVEQIDYYKNKSHKAAKELSSENNKEILLKLVKKVLNE